MNFFDKIALFKISSKNFFYKKNAAADAPKSYEKELIELKSILFGDEVPISLYNLLLAITEI